MICIQETQILTLNKYAETEYPAECCGLLIGRGTQDNLNIDEIIQSPNIAKGNKSTLFEIDPQIRLNTQRRLRNSPQRIIGHFHSHPDAPSSPSPTDLSMAFEAELIWAIVSVKNSVANGTRIYRLDINRHNFYEINYKVI